VHLVAVGVHVEAIQKLEFADVIRAREKAGDSPFHTLARCPS
jgi:hypothetical protein